MGAVPDRMNEPPARSLARQSVLIGVRVRRKGESWFKSRISDMSLTGFRLMSYVKLQVGMEVWVMFAGFEGRKAFVTWVCDHEAGCEFETPMHPAIFDHIVRGAEAD
ncbi:MULTISPECIES: PilZ domain-containing protein [unclassified Sphingobium]|uniref:PilZ domain-containing protein n=1 Tax=unclassified Sphingobium TaxID=2611147 RepID=UPI002224ECCC|nr:MULTISPECIES: PilZ domain-containing protein [unclassified Sphingobium]